MTRKITFKFLFAVLVVVGFSLSAQAQMQVENSDFESWEDLGEQSERPSSWNNLTNAGGDMGDLTSSLKTTFQSEETRPGSEGTYSVKIVTVDVFSIAVANGTMTTGQMQAPSIEPSEGYNLTKTDEEEFRQVFTDKPDSLAVWVKYSITDDSDEARISAILHDDYDYADPEQNEEDADHVVATAVQNFQTDGEWTRLSIPFDYDAGSAEDPEYILLTFTSSAVPGGGVVDATLYVDDLEMIYNEDEVEDDFYFSGFETEGASQNISFEMDGPEEDGEGDYTDEYEMIINPNEDNPDDINFTATFSDDAHIKMWVSGIPDIGDIEIVDSEGNVESPFVGTSDLLSALSAAPDMSFDLVIAGSTTEEPSLDMDTNASSEIITVKVTIDRDYLSVDDFTKNQFSFYPNPAQNELNLEAANSIDEIVLYNVIGQKVKEVTPNETETRINLEDLHSGMYIMKVTVNGKVNSYKLIKQ